MLAIFDIDGTLCDSSEDEVKPFVQSIFEVTGIQLEDADWTRFKHPTSSGVVDELLKNDPEREYKTLAIENRFVQLMEDFLEDIPESFSPVQGAPRFIDYLLKNTAYEVAIATGCFKSEAAFKLDCIGMDIEKFTYATSSDFSSREKVLRLVAKRAGHPLSSVVYFGDASWDIQASQNIGIPLIGIGSNEELFAEHERIPHFPDFSEPERVLKALETTPFYQ
ncbi:MAG: HAD hydrolase-like protein [Verrucomicrobiota bacterium]